LIRVIGASSVLPVPDFGPSGSGFRWVSAGGLFAVLLWVLASVAFAIYLNVRTAER
jgi:hypothetical protein